MRWSHEHKDPDNFDLHLLWQQERHLVELLKTTSRGLHGRILALQRIWSPPPLQSCIRYSNRDRHVQLEASIEAVEVAATFLTQPDPQVRAAAAVALRTAGPLAAPAAPALTRALADPSVPVRIQVLKALRLLPALGPEQVAALADPCRGVRWMAAHALSKPAPSPASDRVMAEWLVHPFFHGKAELDALKALGIVAPGRAKEYLAEIDLGGPDAPHAADLLGRSLPGPASPAVVALLEQRLAATGAPGLASALGRLGPAGGEALLRHLAALQGQARRAAVWGLRVAKRAAPEALLRDPDVGVQLEGASLFAEQGALPLATLVQWADAQPFETLEQLILELRQPTGHVTPLLEHLRDPRDRRVRAKAVTRLDRLAWRLQASK